jgi:hypothetical protein
MYHFSKFNTLLVDDRFNNLSNSSNIENGLLIEPFHDNKSDNICKLLIDIFKKCKKDIMDSSPEDLNVPLLNFNRVKRMKLEKYYKKYKINFDFVYGPKNRKPYKPLNDRSAERLQQNDLLSSDKSEIVYISIGETHQGETNEGFTLIDPNPLNLGARRGRTAASATAAASASTRKNKKLDCPKTCPPGYKCGCIPESDGGRGRGRGGTSRRRRHKRTLKNKK